MSYFVYIDFSITVSSFQLYFYFIYFASLQLQVKSPHCTVCSVSGEESSSVLLGLRGGDGEAPLWWPLSQISVTVKVAMHPFGCEAETSLQDLFEYFQRCLKYGEWELASACVPQLANSTGGLSKNLQDIIKATVCHPHVLQWVTRLHQFMKTQIRGSFRVKFVVYIYSLEASVLMCLFMMLLEKLWL